MYQQFRVARPVTDLQKSAALYEHGLGLRRVGSFEGHAGFDGVMLQGDSAGRTFQDHDGYLVVIQNAAWAAAA